MTLKHVAVGKIGRSISFNPNKWQSTGGDNEPPIFYETLFHTYPDTKFYLLGSTDFSTSTPDVQNRVNKYNNVIDILAPQKMKPWMAQNKDKMDERALYITYLEQWMETEEGHELAYNTLDAGLFFMGPTGCATVYGKMELMKTPGQLASPLLMLARYAGPIIHFLNVTKLPWGMILNDPRYFPAQLRDLFNSPNVIFSQYNEMIKHKMVAAYDRTQELLENHIESKYAGVEKIFLIGKNEPQTEDTSNDFNSFFDDDDTDVEVDSESIEEKTHKFMIVCNQGKPSRYPDLKKYILDHVDDVEIYGKWDEDIIANDSRFKGPKKFNDLQKILARVKYTFCIPIKPGWATAKFWEMINYDIIPFMHPEYDTQKNIGFPEFLRVRSAKELYEKIELLENDPTAYAKMKNILRKMIKDPDDYTGKPLVTSIMTQLEQEISST